VKVQAPNGKVYTGAQISALASEYVYLLRPPSQHDGSYDDWQSELQAHAMQARGQVQWESHSDYEKQLGFRRDSKGNSAICNLFSPSIHFTTPITLKPARPQSSPAKPLRSATSHCPFQKSFKVIGGASCTDAKLKELMKQAIILQYNSTYYPNKVEALFNSGELDHKNIGDYDRFYRITVGGYTPDPEAGGPTWRFARCKLFDKPYEIHTYHNFKHTARHHGHIESINCEFIKTTKLGLQPPPASLQQEEEDSDDDDNDDCEADLDGDDY
jgi:hypothetical protein